MSAINACKDPLPMSFENWAVIALGRIPNKVQLCRTCFSTSWRFDVLKHVLHALGLHHSFCRQTIVRAVRPFSQ
jgi:hypothetical protein